MTIVPKRNLPDLPCPNCGKLLKWRFCNQIYACTNCKKAWEEDGSWAYNLLFSDEDLVGIVDEKPTEEDIEWAKRLAEEYGLE